MTRRCRVRPGSFAAWAEWAGMILILAAIGALGGIIFSAWWLR